MSLSDSLLVQTFREAMRIYDAQKAEGVPKAERLAGLEQSLRAAGFGAATEPLRAADWCPKCENTGLQMPREDCPGDATCGKSRQHLAHEFGRPCWCVLGKRFKDRPQGGEDDFTVAGKAKPRAKTWSRMGR